MDPFLARRLNLLSTICFIGLGGLPHERAVFAPEPDLSGGGGGGGGNPPPAPEPKKLELTQAELDKLIVDRNKKATAEAEELRKRLADLEENTKKLQAERDELDLKGKSAEEKARIAAERAAKKIEDEKSAAQKAAAEATARAEATAAKYRAHVVSQQASDALLAAKALPTAIKHAAQAFLADLTIETDPETYAITSITLGGVAQPSIAKAAEEWLRTYPHFAAAPAGGAGTRNGTTTGNGKPLHELSTNELLRVDASSKR